MPVPPNYLTRANDPRHREPIDGGSSFSPARLALGWRVLTDFPDRRSQAPTLRGSR